MILMIDWGNSYLKFIEIEELSESNIINTEVKRVTDLIELDKKLAQNNFSYKSILISSVRAADENVLLEKLLCNKSLDRYFASTSHFDHGITCAYKKPASLGIDRWLGILAAAKSGESIGIISIGTAITIDIVIDKQHIGGQILPGKQLMINSLSNTGQVKVESLDAIHKHISLGKTTSTCVNFAIEAAIQGYLELVIKSMNDQYQVENWVVTGGGAKVIENLKAKTKVNFNLRPYLIFEGLRISYSE